MRTRFKIILLSVAASTIVLGFVLSASLFEQNLEGGTEKLTISIRKSLSVEEFLETRRLPLSNTTTFKIACFLKRLKHIKPGNYAFSKGMTNTEIIHHLRSGGIPTVDVRLDKASDIYGIAGLLGAALRYDSLEYITRFLDPAFLDSLGTDSMNVAGLILPNTYEFYWNMTPTAFMERMMREQRSLWSNDRIAKAQEIGLTLPEVIILASIVKAETGAIEEADMIAGLYLNRLRINMPLQSDPTALFGSRKQARRVYLSDIESDNPYNTYKFKGLPPGPINLPEAGYIDAVLNAQKHTYIYMCAQEGGTGRHNFSHSLAEHEKNRQGYIRWLNSQKIH